VFPHAHTRHFSLSLSSHTLSHICNTHTTPPHTHTVMEHFAPKMEPSKLKKMAEENGEWMIFMGGAA
jgi:hypothetical protein